MGIGYRKKRKENLLPKLRKERKKLKISQLPRENRTVRHLPARFFPIFIIAFCTKNFGIVSKNVHETRFFLQFQHFFLAEILHYYLIFLPFTTDRPWFTQHS